MLEIFMLIIIFRKMQNNSSYELGLFAIVRQPNKNFKFILLHLQQTRRYEDIFKAEILNDVIGQSFNKRTFLLWLKD